MRNAIQIAAALCIVLMVGGRLEAQDAKSPAVGETISLFNGKDLSGWVWGAGGRNTRIEDVWSVVNGNLRCRGTPNGYIRTERDFTSFILKLQVRHLKPGNGGVLIRMVGQDKVWPKSIEAQGQSGALGDIWNIDRFPMKVDPQRTNDRHTRRMHPEIPEKPLGEWNDYEIIMNGSNLTLKVNGVVQNTASDVEIVAGKICLQSEGSEYEFRNIELTILPDKGTD